MKIMIVLDPGLPDGSAEMRRETFSAVLALTHPGENDLTSWRRVGDLFGPAYDLNPVTSEERHVGVIYVSGSVKAGFYASVDELTIPS